MDYQFIFDLTEKQYTKFLSTQTFTSYRHEPIWSKSSHVKEILFVGVSIKRKLIGAAKIEILNHKNDIYFNIPGGYIIDYTDRNLLFFFTKHIYRMAKEKKAYKIMIDFISEENEKITRNLKEFDYQQCKKKEDFSSISLRANRKFLSVKHFKNMLCTYNVEKDGLFFERITKKTECSRLYEILDNWSYNTEFHFEDLLKKYKENVTIIIEKIDLIFYLNFLRENNARENDIVTIEELIEECGDDYILGFAVVLFPESKENAFCIEIHEQGSFNGLNNSHQLILETLKVGLDGKYRNVVYSSQIAHQDKRLQNHSYELIVNNLKYYWHKIIK